ncbi:MAG: LCP family protein [Firmicutes bacterium]|nr:LCP family protein [Bacillota bacterium]
MGRVDKLHKSKTGNKKSKDNASMDAVLGKQARKIKNGSNIKGKKKKKTNPLNRFIFIMAFILVVLAGAFMTFQYMTNGSKSLSFIPNSQKFNDGEVTILMLGTDGRTEVDGDRSDTIILGRFNFKEGYVRMISIPRDTYVEIPGHGSEKINAAYAYGGVDLTKQTIENFYDITIDRTMEVSFETFTDSVEKLGGIEIVWDDEEPLIYEPYGLNIQPGINKLDAETALKFVRFRGTPTADLGRIGRQQLFLKSLAHDIKSKANLIQQVDIITSMYKGIKTDLSLSEMMYMFNSYKELDNFKITTWMSIGYLDKIDGASVIIPEDNVAELARGFLDGDLVTSTDKEGAIFPELISQKEKAIAQQEDAKTIAEENSK